jgi:hypothetical protein
MPRGDGTGPRGMGAGTGRGLGGCRVRGAGAPKDRDTGYLQRIADSGSGSDGRLTGRGKENGVTMWDVFFALLAPAAMALQLLKTYKSSKGG